MKKFILLLVFCFVGTFCLGQHGVDAVFNNIKANGNITADTLIGVVSSSINQITGTYTGDGTTAQAITGIGFQGTYIKIWIKVTSAGLVMDFFETTTEMLDDNASGLSFTLENKSVINAIKSFDSDGFTVSDASVNSHPNKLNQDYNYIISK